MTADHKILNEEGESRLSHRYAIVVEDLATRWMQSYPFETATSQETTRGSQNLPDLEASPRVKK